MDNSKEQMPQAEEVVEVENMSTDKEKMFFAKEALENLSLELRDDEKFPGAYAYNKVMEIVTSVDDSNETITKWQEDYEAWQKRFEDEENMESFLDELRKNLETALAEAVVSKTEAAEEELLEV